MLSSAISSKKSDAKSGFQQVAKKFIFKYTAVFILLMCLPFGLAYLDLNKPNNLFLGIQLSSLILGIVHIWQMGKRFGWRNHASLFSKLMLTAIILLSSLIISATIIWFCQPVRGLWTVFPFSLLFFMIPLLVISTFDFAIIIPKAVYKKWKYPLNLKLPDPDSIDFTNSHIVTFELKKDPSDHGNTFMKFKAPLDRLTFGDLFYFYMSEYNERNRESPIRYMDDMQQTYDWHFYIKPRKWWQSPVYIDPSLTVRENKILENFIIVSERV